MNSEGNLYSQGQNKSSLSVHRSKQLSSEDYKFQHAPLQAGARGLPTAPAGSSRSLWPGSIAFFDHVARSAPAHILRGWVGGGVAESGAIDHAATLRSLLELCFWAPLLRPCGLRATATWRNSTPKTFPLRRTRTAYRWVSDSYLRRTAACPAQRFA